MVRSHTREEWHLEEGELADLEQRWDPLVGDRTTELVFIGIDMDIEAIRVALDACVLTADEIAEGFDGWGAHPDPLPAWDLHEEFDDVDDLGIDPGGMAR